tara:strand:- start:12317 stop:12769 length:453 start_codon:yes stop_codon:yes gene_type:complete
MKIRYMLFGLLILTSIISCGPTPEWKEKGFSSEAAMNEWLKNNDKYFGSWKHSYTSNIAGFKYQYILNFLPNNKGILTVIENPPEGLDIDGFIPGARNWEYPFSWSILNQTTINVSNLKDQGGYEGNYTISYDSSKLTSDFEKLFYRVKE